MNEISEEKELEKALWAEISKVDVSEQAVVYALNDILFEVLIHNDSVDKIGKTIAEIKKLCAPQKERGEKMIENVLG